MALGCAAASAQADSITDYVHLELGAGITQYRVAGDGRWFQEGMPHSLNLSAPALMAGFTGPLWRRNDWGVDWHVDYVSLAHVSSQCECTPLDSNYSLQTHRLIANPVPVPNANFVGNGNAQGIALTLEPYYLTRGWRFGVEGGLFIYRPAWDETVYNWSPAPGVEPTTIQAHTPNGPQVGGVLGVSVGRGPWSVAYQHYFMPGWLGAKSSPPIYKGADVLMVKYRW